MNDPIEEFLSCPAIAVVGASNDPSKYGHRCFAALLRHGRKAYPVNPRASTVLGHTAYPSLATLPETVKAVSVITPPQVTEQVVDDAIAAGATHIWMQPGAESTEAIERARQGGLTVIAGGPCLLIELH